jgi:RHS repeat-associated protein
MPWVIPQPIFMIRGNVIQQVDALGGIITMEYDDENNVIKTTDANNLVTKFSYDISGNLTSRSETYCGCAGIVPGTTTYTYNAFGQPISVILPTGASIYQDFDNNGNLITLRDGKGGIILSYTYDSKGNVLSETSEGSTSTYKYDKFGNVIETIDDDGKVTKAEYNANNRLIKMNDRDGNISTYSYDSKGRKLRDDYGNGVYINYSYTATSPDWTVIEGSTIGRQERKFTADGKIAGWVTPEGNITFSYDAVGKLWKETQPDGRTTEYIYDAVGRVIQTKDLSTGLVASKNYNVGGQLLSDTDSFGRTTNYTYDRNGKIASSTNALGQTYTFTYNGSSTTVTDPLGRKTTSVNNDYYLPSRTIYSNGAASNTEYLYTSNLQGAKNYPTKTVDIDGKVRTYSYDSNGNLTSTTDLAGKTYTYGHGINGISDITSPTGVKISYGYDSNGNLSRLSYGSQLAKQYTYTSDNQLQTITNSSGSSITNTYDGNGKISGVTLKDANGNTSNVANTYDIKGNISSLTNSTGVKRYQYDSNGNVIQINSANGLIVNYERDNQGRITTQTEKANAAATGLITKFSYDILGNLLTVTDSRNRVTTMTYDGVNRLASKILPNGVKTAYVYDDLDRTISILYTKADGTVLASETYTRNIGGEPSKVLREDGSYTLYEYDAAVRLNKEVSYNLANQLLTQISYSYDADGKRTRKVDVFGTQDYGYNADGQLVSVGQNQSYIYDTDGRLKQSTRDNKTINLSHDPQDRLTQVEVNGTTTQYLYDAQGNRIKEISGSNTKNYLVAPNLSNGLESTDLVTDENGNVVADYVYGGSGIIARLDVNGEPIYYLTDSMGSVIGLVDGQGNRLSRIIYDGFGDVVSGDDGSSLGGDFRFQGQWLEGESGLYYMRARDYDAQTGLFLSRDPVDAQQQSVEGFNPYQFAFGNPLVYSDPTGLFSLSEINAADVIDRILEGIKTQAVGQVKNYLTDKAKGLVTDIAVKLLQELIPSFPGLSAIVDFGKAGLAFEDLVTKGICGVIGQNYSQYTDALWFEAKVDTNGNPQSNGFHCGDVNTDLKAARSTAKSGSVIAPRPDFIIKQGAPKDTDKNPKAYLIGDFKITVKAARRSVDKNTTQWQATLGYAEYKNGHQYVPFTLFFTFYGDKSSQLDIASIQSKSNLKKVRTEVTQLVSRIK